MLCSAVFEVIAVDRRDNDMLQPEFFDRNGHAFWLISVECVRQSRAHVAECACPRAGIAHDHHGGVLFRPALTNVRTTRLFANRDEVVFLHDLTGFFVNGGTARPHTNPGRLLQDIRIGPVRLFGVARFFCDCVENGYHAVDSVVWMVLSRFI